MKKDRIYTTSIREIKSSFKRFLSLLVMSMLGVLVFVGIKMAAPDMMESLDKYYDNNNLYDIKLVSTLGLTNLDINKLNEIENIDKVYFSNSKDVIAKINKDEAVIKVIGINNDINKIKVLSGKMPSNNHEILLEEAMLKEENLKIGDIISIEDDSFKENKLKIVGSVKSPLYITSVTGTANRGNTTISSGKINYYAYMNNDNFNLDYYTELYVTVKNAKKELTNSKKYNKLINNALDEIDKIKEERQLSRYNEIYNKYKEEIEKERLENESKLNDAKKLLDNTKMKLDNGKKDLDLSKKKLDDANISLLNNKQKLDDSKKDLDNMKLLLDESKKKIDESIYMIDEKLSIIGLSFDDINKIIDYIDNINISKDEIINKIPVDTPNYDEIVFVIDKIYDLNLKDKFKEFIFNGNIDDFISYIPSDIPYYNELIEYIKYISNNNIIDEIIDELPSDVPYYDDILKVLNYYNEHKDDFKKLIFSIKEIRDGKLKYNSSLELYNSYIKEYDDGYIKYLSYYNEYQNGLSIYNNSLRKYDSSLSLYNSKLKEYYESRNMFESSIKDAINKLGDIPNATWYTYTRLDDNGYSSFIDDSNSLSNLSAIFPSIFFIVAVLISLISMSRMVEDDRSLIGTFKSLGFSNKHIRKKYLLYSFLATIIGATLGAIIGFFLLPKFIWNIYKILFDIPVFKYSYNPLNIIIGIFLSCICICGTTLITIRKVVKEKPSDLMRPKAPANGKRVLLEKIPFIWNNINFSNKITARNLFRYKKRVFMTVFGILGCTALMLAGFGIRDSIIEIPEKQYNDIFKFNELVYLNGNSTKEELDSIFNNEHIIKRLDTNMTLSTKIGKYDINLFVPYEKNDMKDIINLRDKDSKEKLNLEYNKVIISNKLSSLLNKGVEDEIEIVYPDNKVYKFVISGICENYVSNYVFMDKDTYEDNIGTYQSNVSYLKLDNIKYEEDLSKELLSNDGVMSIMSVNQTINSVNNMLKSLNNVVLILIILSGALSFVVLYNLSYINISERKREIATLKVLGFTNKEVDDYIVKETIILTIIAIVLGLMFGILLTNVILNTVEIEQVKFIHHIKFNSYIKTSILVMLFTIIVSIITHFTLKKIDMIESLKSVE